MHVNGSGEVAAWSLLEGMRKMAGCAAGGERDEEPRIIRKEGQVHHSNKQLLRVVSRGMALAEIC
jgi:hypothetical protein